MNNPIRELYAFTFHMGRCSFSLFFSFTRSFSLSYVIADVNFCNAANDIEFWLPVYSLSSLVAST